MDLRFLIISVLFITLFTYGCIQQNDTLIGENMTQTDVDLTTNDGVNIKATYYDDTEGTTGVVLLHQLGRDRKDWDQFAKDLQAAGYKVMAVDLRGHGDSALNWQSFSSSDFNNMIYDVRAAKDFLSANGAKKVGIIGASIGGNVALNYGSIDSEILTVVLLSPGLDYKGVKTTESIKEYRGALLTVASEEDVQSANASRQLHSLSPSTTKKLQIYEEAGHGIDMFKEEKLHKLLVDWLKNNLN